jgi:gas vesicle protein
MNKKILAGMLTGMATGVVATLLFSSKKGRKARRKLTAQGSNLAGKLKQQFTDFIDQAADRLQPAPRK